MGSIQFKQLDAKELVNISERTKIPANEVQESYGAYQNLLSMSGGTVTMDAFVDFFSSVGNKGNTNSHLSDDDTKLYSEQLFKVLDKDKNGEISFEEFLIANKLLNTDFKENTSEESANEIFEFIFNIMDINQDGKLSLSELEDMLFLFEKMDNKNKKKEEQLRTDSKKNAREMLEKCDTNKDGLIQREEFIKTLKENKELLLKINLA